MANLSLNTWERYVPNLGENKALEQPFYLEVRAGLTKAQYSEFQAKLKDTSPEDGAAIHSLLEGLVRMGKEPLTIEGQAVSTLLDYCGLLAQQKGGDLYFELLGALTWHNSAEGAMANFSARSSGGRSFIATSAPKTAASTAGSGTSH